MPIYEFECVVCAEKLDVVQQLSNAKDIYHCDTKCRKLISKPFVYKDKRFDFLVTNADRKEQEVRSKGQFDRYLKKNGLVTMTPSDKKHFRHKDMDKEIKKSSEKIAKLAVKTIAEKGGMDWVTGKENPKGVDKVCR